MNQQREVVYDYRNDVLDSSDTRVLINEAIDKGIREKVAEYVPEDGKSSEPIQYGALINWANTTFPVGISSTEADFENKNFGEIVQFLIDRVQNAYNVKTRDGLPQIVQDLERMILLNAIDRLWQEHLYALDALKEGVGLRTHGQKDPLIEFKIEAYNIFAELMRNINSEVLGNLFRGMAQLQAFEEFLRQAAQQRRAQQEAASITINSSQEAPATVVEAEAEAPAAPKSKLLLPSMIKKEVPKAGRNDPCPCGSGKKFKSCCGRLS